jgi:hypothetical protein
MVGLQLLYTRPDPAAPSKDLGHLSTGYCTTPADPIGPVLNFLGHRVINPTKSPIDKTPPLAPRRLLLLGAPEVFPFRSIVPPSAGTPRPASLANRSIPALAFRALTFRFNPTVVERHASSLHLLRQFKQAHSSLLAARHTRHR